MGAPGYWHHSCKRTTVSLLCRLLLRFMVWRALKDESAKAVVHSWHLSSLSWALQLPYRRIMGLFFKTMKMCQLMKNWDVELDFSCAYRAQGNGLIERTYRTIKRTAARSGRRWHSGTIQRKVNDLLSLMKCCLQPNRVGQELRTGAQEILRNWAAQTAEGKTPDVTWSTNPFAVGDLVYL